MRQIQKVESGCSCRDSFGVTLEAASCDVHQLRDACEIPVGIDYLGMPHIDRQCRQTSLYIRFLPIEPQCAMHDEGVPKIVQPMMTIVAPRLPVEPPFADCAQRVQRLSLGHRLTVLAQKE